jgi:hypothetical protein
MKLPTWKIWIIVVSFVVSLVVIMTCYYMAWHGGYYGICGLFISSMWGGLTRWFAKVLTEA